MGVSEISYAIIVVCGLLLSAIYSPYCFVVLCMCPAGMPTASMHLDRYPSLRPEERVAVGRVYYC